MIHFVLSNDNIANNDSFITLELIQNFEMNIPCLILNLLSYHLNLDTTSSGIVSNCDILVSAIRKSLWISNLFLDFILIIVTALNAFSAK